MIDTVLVTGATGFVAQHCILALLEAGYRVRATARDPSAASALQTRLAPLLSPAGRALLAELSVVLADLSADRGWDEAVRGCRYVLHVASPLPAAPPRHEQELIVPARDGVLRVLRAAAQAGVQRVVLTSSIAAIVSGVVRDKLLTESDWSNLEGPSVGAYEKSKTLAERAAWDFVRGLPQERALELTVLNPGLVLGPIFAGAVSTSGLVIQKLLNRDFPACPDIHFAIVDARDLAAAQLLAMTSPKAAGERFICAVEDVSMRTVAQVLHANFKQLGFDVPTGNLPDIAVRAFALFDKSVRLALQNLGRPERVDNSKIKRVLGWKPRPLEETIVAMAESMIAQHVVRPRKGLRAAAAWRSSAAWRACQ